LGIGKIIWGIRNLPLIFGCAMQYYFDIKLTHVSKFRVRPIADIGPAIEMLREICG
jgi:hypothetical protein